jgi:hypothetical protein
VQAGRSVSVPLGAGRSGVSGYGSLCRSRCGRLLDGLFTVPGISPAPFSPVPASRERPGFALVPGRGEGTPLSVATPSVTLEAAHSRLTSLKPIFPRCAGMSSALVFHRTCWWSPSLSMSGRLVEICENQERRAWFQCDVGRCIPAKSICSG